MTSRRRGPVPALLWLSLFPLLLLSACRTTAPAPTAPDAHLGAVLSADDPRPGAFLEHLLQEGRERRSLRGVADLALDGPNGSARAKQIVLLEKPARLRVEVLGFLSQSVAVLTTDGTRFRLFRAKERTIEEGEIRPSLLWEVAGIALRPDTAVRVLLGTPALPDGARPLPPRATRQGGVRLAFAYDEFVVAVEFDRDGALRRWGIEEQARRQVFIEAIYSDYAPLAGTEFAHQIELSDHRNGTRARVQFADIDLNPDLPPEVFALETRRRR